MTRLRLIPALLVIGFVASCAGRGSLTLAPDPAQVGSLEPILVASSRQRDPGGPGYGRAPAPGLGFSQFTVSVPPDREPGTVTFPRQGAPDPRRDFLTVDSTVIADRAGFVRAVNTAVAARPRNQREVLSCCLQEKKLTNLWADGDGADDDYDDTYRALPALHQPLT